MENGELTDDEVSKDPGAHKSIALDENDIEGHRAHSVFVGVHIPVERRHSHRRHKHHNKSDNGRDGSEDKRPETPPSRRVQFILGEDLDDGKHESHPLFSEMEELVTDGDEMEWKETARWIKFEEDVEEGGNRWSKPHVGTLSLHSLFELRSLILNETIVLDIAADSLMRLSEMIVEHMVNNNSIPSNKKMDVKEVILKRHRHQHQRKDYVLPIIRSFTEIGRNHSSGRKKPKDQRKKRKMQMVEEKSRELKRNGSYIAVPGQKGIISTFNQRTYSLG